MKLLKVTGHQKITSPNELNISSVLVPALQSRGQHVEKSSTKLIVFSSLSFIQSMYRYDCFSGVKNGEIRISPDTEGKKTIHFSLDISSVSYLLFAVTFGNMVTWPIFNIGKLSYFIKNEMTILLLSLAAFFIYREFVRFATKRFILRTFKHLH